MAAPTSLTTSSVQANALYSTWKLVAFGSFSNWTARAPPYNVTPAIPNPKNHKLQWFLTWRFIRIHLTYSSLQTRTIRQVIHKARNFLRSRNSHASYLLTQEQKQGFPNHQCQLGVHVPTMFPGMTQAGMIKHFGYLYVWHRMSTCHPTSPTQKDPAMKLTDPSWCIAK